MGQRLRDRRDPNSAEYARYHAEKQAVEMEEQRRAVWRRYYEFNFYDRTKEHSRSLILEEKRLLDVALERLRGADSLSAWDRSLVLTDVKLHHRNLKDYVDTLEKNLRKPTGVPPPDIFNDYADSLPRISPDGHPVGTARDDTAEYQDFVNRIRSQMPDQPSAPAPPPPRTDGYE